MPGRYSTNPHGAFEIFLYLLPDSENNIYKFSSLPPSFLPSRPPPFLPSPKGRYLSQVFLSFCVCYKLSTVSIQGLQIPHSQINKLQVEIIHKKKLHLYRTHKPFLVIIPQFKWCLHLDGIQVHWEYV